MTVGCLSGCGGCGCSEELGEPGEITKLPNGHNKALWNMRRNGWDITIIVTCTDKGADIDIHKEKI